MGTTVIKRTAVAPTLATKCTYSFWTKRSLLGTSQCFAGNDPEGASGYVQFRWFHTQENAIRLEATSGDGSGAIDYKTFPRFWDANAWYHIVIACDASQSTQADRFKVYVNGVQITGWASQTTSWDTDDYLSWQIAGRTQYIGTYSGSDDLYDGYFSQYIFVDGTAYAASDFGEFENGTWKAKSSPSVTYGDNGFHLKFADGALLTDSSGNGNNFSLHSGTQLYSRDKPDNSFPTISRFLGKQSTNYYSPTTTNLKYGNLSSTSATNDKSITATMALHKGKWYWETKLYGNNNTRNLGIVRADMIGLNSYFYNGSNTSNGTPNTMNYNPRTSYGYVITTDKDDTGTESASMLSTDSDCIVGHYLDMDNGKMAWSLNGTLINSGSSFPLPNWSDDPNLWTIFGAFPSGRFDHNQVADYNFGLGFFGITAVSSSVADAGGEGSFEYNPTATIDSSSQDFRAICTKNIKTYG